MTYSKIILPVHPQPDTIIAIFILKTFGEAKFPGVSKATIEFRPLLGSGDTEESLDKAGAILIDLGGGRFDHHNKQVKKTASDLVAEYLEIAEDPSLAKLLEYARRDDFFGKGTISTDAIDRAFGLSGLVSALNKTWPKEPQKIIEIVLPLIEAHFSEENRRTKELPKEVEEKMANGQAFDFKVKQRDKNLKVIIIDSENRSLPGFLRSQLGGRFDVVAQRLPSGHVNILTRPTKRVDLRMAAAFLRLEELRLGGKEEASLDMQKLTKPGHIDEVKEWYFDPATNSLLNGGPAPKDILPTKISKENLPKILELGLSKG